MTDDCEESFYTLCIATKIQESNSKKVEVTATFEVFQVQH